MNYWELRKEISKVIPRQSQFVFKDVKAIRGIKEKGRKSNYQQFNLIKNEWEKIERLLDLNQIKFFVEVSVRAQSCPMPLNIDVWDGLRCPFGCRYCYADYFKSSLYSSFYDNYKQMGLRHCDVDYVKRELEELMKYRGQEVSGNDKIKNAIRQEIPMRFGIRFEDFISKEKKEGVSLELLKYLSDLDYPVMINTKSSLVGDEEYVKALSSNKGKAAVHMTLISSDNDFLKRIEPGAPSLQARLDSCKKLSEEGIRVICRIEPYMIFFNDSKDMIDDYIGKIKEVGVQHITWDTYSYSANSIGIADNFRRLGMDWDRMFLLTSDSQWLGSILLGKLMEYFRDKGIKSSTFDFGNVPTNDNFICCEVGDWFEGGFNYGCGVSAIRYIVSKKGKPCSWSSFDQWVIGKGGWLSNFIKEEVRRMWNLVGNIAWSINWGSGIEPFGSDSDGIIWKYNKKKDFRLEKLEGIL